MKIFLLFLSCTILLLTACNPTTPPAETGNSTTEPQTEETANRVLETDKFGQVAPDNLCFDVFCSFQENVTTLDQVKESVGQFHRSLSHVDETFHFFWDTVDGTVEIEFYTETNIVAIITYHPHDTQTT